VVYKIRNIIDYPDGAAVNEASVAGSNFPMKDGTILLRSEDEVIAKAKLSLRCSSTIGNWLKGNIWISDDRLANSSRKAASFELMRSIAGPKLKSPWHPKVLLAMLQLAPLVFALFYAKI